MLINWTKGADIKPSCVAAECFSPYYMEKKVKNILHPSHRELVLGELE